MEIHHYTMRLGMVTVKLLNYYVIIMPMLIWATRLVFAFMCFYIFYKIILLDCEFSFRSCLQFGIYYENLQFLSLGIFS